MQGDEDAPLLLSRSPPYQSLFLFLVSKNLSHEILTDSTFPAGRAFEAVGVGLVIEHGLVDGVLGGEHKGTVLDDFLIERGTGDEDYLSMHRRIGWLVSFFSFRGKGAKESKKRTKMAVFLGICIYLDVNRITRLFKDHVMIWSDRLGVVSAGTRKGCRAGEGVGETIPVGRKRLPDVASRFDGDVQEPDGRVREIADAVDAVGLARDDFDVHATVVDVDRGDLLGAEIPVARIDHLQLLRQVDPQLQTNVGTAIWVLMRHLSVHDALPRRHEL